MDDTGLSNVWLSQGQNVSTAWLKANIKQTLMDQYQQHWLTSVFNSSKCDNYRMFKTRFGFENYLVDLSPKLCESFTRFRCRNHKLPIEVGIYPGIIKEERHCTLCDSNDLGDEFHYIFSCEQFQQQRNEMLKI